MTEQSRLKKMPSLFAITFALCLILVSSGYTFASASPFASTGLLVRPDEQPEHILMRAHRLDSRAILLTVAGYGLGIGGFPKDRNLASVWAGKLLFLNSLEAMRLGTLIVAQEVSVPDDELGFRLGDCDMLQNSKLAGVFSKSGIFDVKDFCSQLTMRSASVPGLRGKSREIREGTEEIQRHMDTALAAVRTFRDRPDPATLRGLLSASELLPVGPLLLYAATTHNPGTEAPDWSTDRLLAFHNALVAQRDLLSGAETQKTAEKLTNLASEAQRAMRELLLRDTAEELLIIRSAHAAAPAAVLLAMEKEQTKDLDALRAMAQHYRDGTMGFVKDDLLEQYWLQHAAIEGDGVSQFLLAVNLLEQKRFADAWAWGYAAKEGTPGKVTPQMRRLGAQLVSTIESRAGKDIRIAGINLANKWLEEVNERFEWRKKSLKENKNPATP